MAVASSKSGQLISVDGGSGRLLHSHSGWIQSISFHELVGIATPLALTLTLSASLGSLILLFIFRSQASDHVTPRISRPLLLDYCHRQPRSQHGDFLLPIHPARCGHAIPLICGFSLCGHKIPFLFSSFGRKGKKATPKHLVTPF